VAGRPAASGRAPDLRKDGAERLAEPATQRPTGGLLGRLELPVNMWGNAAHTTAPVLKAGRAACGHPPCVRIDGVHWMNIKAPFADWPG